MATDTKPAAHFRLPDWHHNNYAIATSAENSREISTQVRNEAQWLENETKNVTEWMQHDNTTRLRRRCDDITDWKEQLERTRELLEKEIAALKADKLLVEDALEAKALPLDVANDNLTIRDGRRDIDLVDDLVEKELRKEVDVIEGAKAALQQKSSEAFEQLCRLEEALQQINRDLEHKNTALDIDLEQHDLTEDHPEISFHPDPTRTPKGSTTPQQWDEFSRYNKARADAEMRSSKSLREAIHATIDRTSNDIDAQRRATEYAFRKRIRDFEKALNELEWQKKSTEDDIARMLKKIADLEASVKAKANPLKLAMTRLENRTCRPGVEKCRDNAQYGLCEEVRQLEATIEALKLKLKEANSSLTDLYKNLDTINADIDLKTQSLDMDNHCMKVREKLTGKAERVASGSAKVPEMA